LIRAPVLALLFASMPAAAQMYKCVDAKGVTHYTETPVKGCRGNPVDIKPQAPIGTQVAPKEDIGGQEREFRRRQLERGVAAEKSAAEAKQREQRCLAAKAEHARPSNSRLFDRNAKGERVFLDDSATAQRRAQSQENVDRACR